MLEDQLPPENLIREKPNEQSGFIKFYGLYWRKDCVDWDTKMLLGRPSGWTGKGKIATNFDKMQLQINCWDQKGVYVLYNSDMTPVYAGQAGLSRKNATESGRSIGDRLNDHSRGLYRNGWQLFSWFGFLSTEKLNLKKADERTRMAPKWQYHSDGEQELNLLLASFEAILIEGFAPRFNSRGGDLKGATLVDQYENYVSTN